MSALWSLQFGFVKYVRISNNDSSIVINGDFKSFIVSFVNNNDEQLCETMVINSINSKYLPKRIVVSQKEYDSKHVMSYYDVLEIIKRLYNNDFRGEFDQQ